MAEEFQTDDVEYIQKANAAGNPLILALPPEIAEVISRSGRIRTGMPGDLVPAQGELVFVSSGALAPTDPSGRIGTELFGGGSVYGLENLFSDDAPVALEVVLKAQWIAVAASAVAAAVSTSWGERMYAHQARRRLKVLAHEAFCGRDHPPVGRTAKQLLTLHDCSAASEIAISQYMLAEMVGCTRSTMNGHLSQLQAVGAIRQGRLKIHVKNRDRLIAEACCYEAWR